MKYYLDCEFNGMGGELLSLALVSEAGPKAVSFYIVRPQSEIEAMKLDPWVEANVLPIMGEIAHISAGIREWPRMIQAFLRFDTDITIITDWPDDIKYFCELIITGPGTMIEVRPSIKFEMHRVDAYPTTLPGAVQHNAYWDAMALRHKLQAPNTPTD